MPTLPADCAAFALLAFALGLRHGLDPDHLATIDGLTRAARRVDGAPARLAGLYFSLGHGAVVVAVACAVSVAAAQWQAPPWLGITGTLISIAVLVTIGVLNLHAVATTPADEVVAVAGLRSRLWRHAVMRSRAVPAPLAALAVGALFAVSVDTMSQSVLFALAGTRFGGVGYAALFGTAFTAGMLATDALNGLWIARLLQRADATARLASRAMGLAIAAVALAVAGWTALRALAPAVDAWGDGKEPFFGAVVVGVLITTYLVGRVRAAARVGNRALPTRADPGTR